jgi:hypothetical protein
MFSMAKRLQQPCFVENMGGIDEDALHQLPLLKSNLHHFQMLRVCFGIWQHIVKCLCFTTCGYRSTSYGLQTSKVHVYMLGIFCC